LQCRSQSTSDHPAALRGKPFVIVGSDSKKKRIEMKRISASLKYWL
jgi:hypothetical protein